MDLIQHAATVISLVCDNRQAMHRVEHNYDLAEQRLMHRIILKGQRPV